MLERIYIDNFRCFVNFELKGRALNLLLGENGSGKSTLFDALRKVQAFVGGSNLTNAIFQSDDMTVWQDSPIQTFEVDIAGNGGSYRYTLALERHDDAHRKVTVHHEELRYDKHVLLKFDEGSGNVQLLNDDYSTGPVFPFNPLRSVFGSLPERPDNTKLSWFRHRMQRFVIVQLTPKLMQSDSHREEEQLSADGGNFVSWYRYLYQDQGKAMRITAALQEVLEGFAYFKLDTAGPNHRVLSAYFTQADESNSKAYPYRFDQLSDGQRALIALHCILHYARSEDYTICIDEPANFLALPEVQPWLVQLEEFCQDGELQAFLISHHPEIINYAASSAGYWFERGSNAQTRVKALPEYDPQGVPFSELIARRWLDG